MRAYESRLPWGRPDSVQQQTRHAKHVAALRERIGALDRDQQHGQHGHLPRVAAVVGGPNSAFTSEVDFDAYASFRQTLGTQQRVAKARKIDAANRALSHNLQGIHARQGTYNSAALRRESEALERYRRARADVRRRKFGGSGDGGSGGGGGRKQSKKRRGHPHQPVLTSQQFGGGGGGGGRGAGPRHRAGSKSVRSSPNTRAARTKVGPGHGSGGMLMSAVQFHQLYSPSRDKLAEAAQLLGFERRPEPPADVRAATDVALARVDAVRARQDPGQAKYVLRFTVPQHSAEATTLLRRAREGLEERQRQRDEAARRAHRAQHGRPLFEFGDNDGNGDGHAAASAAQVGDGERVGGSGRGLGGGGGGGGLGGGGGGPPLLSGLFIDASANGQLVVLRSREGGEHIGSLPSIHTSQAVATDNDDGGDEDEGETRGDTGDGGGGDGGVEDRGVDSGNARGSGTAPTAVQRKAALIRGLDAAMAEAEQTRNRFPLLAVVRRVVAAGYKYERKLVKAVTLVQRLAAEAGS